MLVVFSEGIRTETNLLLLTIEQLRPYEVIFSLSYVFTTTHVSYGLFVYLYQYFLIELFSYICYLSLVSSLNLLCLQNILWFTLCNPVRSDSTPLSLDVDSYGIVVLLKNKYTYRTTSTRVSLNTKRVTHRGYRVSINESGGTYSNSLQSHFLVRSFTTQIKIDLKKPVLTSVFLIF